MLLELGDTAAAVHQLDATLDAIPRMRSILLEATPQAATLGRALLMRAQLAMQLGDRATARRRFAQVEALWSAAEPALRARLDSLRRRL
jgi:hypothetical protein